MQVRLLSALGVAAIATACIAAPAYAPGYGPATGGGASESAPDVTAPSGGGAPGPVSASAAAPQAGRLVDQSSDFAFDGGRIDFELRQVGDHVLQIARNRYAVPIVMQWTIGAMTNLSPTGPVTGVVVLPAAARPDGEGPPVELVAFEVDDRRSPFHRDLSFHARFGDPHARPASYAYALPYGKGQTFSVLQGFHGAFSHRGSNEFALDFDCPVATGVRAARPGLVVAANASAQGSGITPEFLDLHRVNFVLVLHDDGTIGEYMHLAPSGVIVAPGQRVARGEALALSGNTGYSSTPHLHFQVMTAADDGEAARSFPFELAAGPRSVESPVQGRAYPAWE